jgi:1-deoxy-D-xylulose-5-phosphate reductoisomerase
MTDRPKQVAVLGSTGSIGRSALEVIEHSADRLRVVALSGNSSVDLLVQQAAQFKPRWLVVSDRTAAKSLDRSRLPSQTELLVGPEALERVAAEDEVDVVLSAIVGSAGLLSTVSALSAGKRVALANKESLVVGGDLVTQLARQNQAEILPVDSEHSAVFQAMRAGRRDEVRRVVLTASGGPFRTYTAEQLAQVTVEQALAHPTWEMGRKITVDSATMMNKALEIVEARWLFDLNPDQIAVCIHPQSVVHSMVEYKDGSVVAQLSPPDMKLPIQYALDWPERHEGVSPRLDWNEAWRLEFEPPDFERFGALKLGLEVARTGGTAGAVLNGANEAAVAAFLDGRLSFARIVPAVRAALDNHDYEPHPDLARLLEADRWAREEVIRWIGV